MEGIKYVNLIEIGPVVIEIRGAENGELAVPVNNTLVSHTAFLAADTRPCVLIRMLLLHYNFHKLYLFKVIVANTSSKCAKCMLFHHHFSPWGNNCL